MRLYLKRDNQWFEVVDEQLLKDSLAVFALEADVLRLMISFDTGWTGMIFQAADETFALCENWNHVVDVREAWQPSQAAL